MLGTQSVAVLTFMTIPVMATEMAPDFGVEAKDIAVFMSLVFAASMFFSAASGSIIRRFGGIRANQIGMAFSACCLLLVLFESMPLLLIAALLIGFGYGPNTPSGSHILARVTPVEQRAFVFSIKQSGAPIGGLIAGLLVPAIVVNFGWQAAIVTAIAIAFTAVVGIQPLRDALDDDRVIDTRISFSSPWHAIRTILKQSGLRRLTLVAFFLSTIQASIMAFLVIYLVEEIALPFTLAGMVFAAAQAAGALTRIAVGWLADRHLGTRPTLIVLGSGAACGLIALSLLSASSPLWIVIGISTAVGAMSFGWNGVFLAEIATSSSGHDVGTATGGSLFFIYGAIVTGPLLMHQLIRISGGYTIPFVLAAVLTLAACGNLLREHRAGNRSAA